VLLFAAGVGEAEVDELDLVFLDELEYIGDGLCHQFLLSWMVVRNTGKRDCRFCAIVASADEALVNAADPK
jgi:hypothetical protein